MRRYVVGFLVDFTGETVVLIDKNRPKWQRGRLNGIGGHIEQGESPAEAMRREFREEAGLDIDDWTERVVLTGVDGSWSVHFFVAARPRSEVLLARTTSDERVSRHYVRRLPDQVIRNLRWLIPLCLDGDVAPCNLVDVAPTPADGAPRPRATA